MSDEALSYLVTNSFLLMLCTFPLIWSLKIANFPEVVFDSYSTSTNYVENSNLGSFNSGQVTSN